MLRFIITIGPETILESMKGFQNLINQQENLYVQKKEKNGGVNVFSRVDFSQMGGGTQS